MRRRVSGRTVNREVNEEEHAVIDGRIEGRAHAQLLQVLHEHVGEWHMELPIERG